MTDIVCPNCDCVTPPYRRCMACNADLSALYGNSSAKPTGRRKPDHWWYLLNLQNSWRRLLPSHNGREIRPMDARLIRACRRTTEKGIHKLGTTSTLPDHVAVIAKVDNVDQFTKLIKCDAKDLVEIKNPDDDKLAIVTARLKANEEDIESLRNQPCVRSLKAARRIQPYLDRTIGDAHLYSDHLLTSHEGNGGEGVIIGIVDFGLDFVHRNLRNSNGTTRILALWDQKARTNEEHCPKPYGYGRLIEADEINNALDKFELEDADPYKTLGYEVSADLLFEGAAHGTYAADVAAGNKLGAGCPGIAPQAQIVFVDISTAGRPKDNSEVVGSTFGDSVQLLEAIHFIFNYANGRPCVVNVSLGTNGGPHDGTTPLEQAIDWMVKQEPNRAVVIAAGNSFGKRIHCMGQVPEGGCADLRWKIPSYDATGNELEIWYEGKDRFTVELFDPKGRLVARVKPGCEWENDRASKERMIVVNRLNDPNNEDNTINIYFERGVRDGIWTVRLHGDHVSEGCFHAWIERDEGGQSKFVKSEDRCYTISDDYTLSSIACGHETIVVSSFDDQEPDRPLCDTSSAGPTRDKRPQPTVSAPGENMLVARPKTLVLRHRQSGTSLAAAGVTGTVALMLSEAKEHGITLTAQKIREILAATADKKPLGDKVWDSGYGYGIVCAKAAVEDVRRHLKAMPRRPLHEASHVREQVYYSNGRKCR